jgi:hypothetical protein
VKKIYYSVLTVALLFAAVATVAAQQNQKLDRPIQTEPSKDDDSGRPFNQIEEEMRAKREISYAEKQYKDNVERARDLSSLGLSIVDSYKTRKVLSEEDLRKLEKVEKLAKGIRNAAGGSEDDATMDSPPKDLAAAMEMLGCLSSSLKDKVEKTPRHVISAAVIDEANVLLELIRIVRAMPSKV